MTKQELIDRVETLVDGNSLSDVIEALVEICELKAEHVESNWQDQWCAKEWRGNARKLERANRDLVF